jgi:cytochrome oxidase Cu insertion factor (SCO1/SenC/PrrC family)
LLGILSFLSASIWSKSEQFKELKMLNEKETAPDFELLDDMGQPTKLSDFRGKRVVLYFFPKAMTSG